MGELAPKKKEISFGRLNWMGRTPITEIKKSMLRSAQIRIFRICIIDLPELMELLRSFMSPAVSCAFKCFRNELG